MPTIHDKDARKLYEQLQAFQFSTESTEYTFADRLAEENGWNQTHTAAVLEEYRRFLVLQVCSDHAATPSEDVDQAWHLHMIYTQSYWIDLCENVLGQPLHHIPMKGGEQEQEKFLAQYTQTLNSYQQLFNEAPSTLIWPSPEERFADNQQAKREEAQKKQHLAQNVSLVFIGAVTWYVAGVLTGSGTVGFALMLLTLLIVQSFFPDDKQTTGKAARGLGGGCGGAGGCGGGGGG